MTWWVILAQRVTTEETRSDSHPGTEEPAVSSIVSHDKAIFTHSMMPIRVRQAKLRVADVEKKN